jgi:heat shock protein HslJ
VTPSVVESGHTSRMITVRRVFVGSLLAVLPLGAVACGDDSKATPPEDTVVVSQLQGNTYELVGASGIAVPDGSALTMTFAATNLAISGGCNEMTGAWRIELNRLMVPRLAQTEKACDDALETFDAQIAQTVGAQPVINLISDTMTLVRDSVTLTFRNIERVPDVPLEGTPWTLTGTLEGDATASLDTEPATIVFNDGTAEVFAGCNTGSQPYTATDTTIEFGAMALTKMACEEAATKMENTVLAVLEGSRTYDIEGTKLTIATPDGKGLTFTSAP